jgi:hypothetical protein
MSCSHSGRSMLDFAGLWLSWRLTSRSRTSRTRWLTGCARAERNRRSLQRELLSILEAAVDERISTGTLPAYPMLQWPLRWTRTPRSPSSGTQ